MNIDEPKTSKSLLHWLMVGGIALLATGAGVFTSLQFSSPGDHSGAQMEPAADAEEEALAALQSTLTNTQIFPKSFKRVPEFSLLGADGEALDQTLFEGQWTTVFFGFTHCPDVCPITLSVMKEGVQSCATNEEVSMQVAFVSVDPNRDTPDKLKNYIEFFNPEFLGITGELAPIHELTRHLGIVASYTANKEDPANYTVDHTASMLLIDPQRRVRAKFNLPHEAATILSDYLKVRASLG